jgi:hypothetical protein
VDLLLVQISEPRASERDRRRRPLVGVAGEEPLQEVESIRGQELLGKELPQHAGVADRRQGHHGGEREGLECRPRRPLRHAEHAEYPAEHLHVVLPVEERLPGEELRHDAAEGPHVHHRVVVGLPQEHLRRLVPERASLPVRRLGDRGGEPEVAYLDGDGLAVIGAGADKDVPGLYVPVHDLARVHVLGPGQELPHDEPHLRLRERAAGAVAASVEYVVEVGPDALHHERDLGLGGVDGDRVQADQRRVAAAGREELGLPQRLVGHSHHLRPSTSWRAECLHGDGLARGAVPRLDDGAEAALPEHPGRLVVRCRPETAPLAPPRPRAGGVVVVAVEQEADGSDALGEHRNPVARIAAERRAGGW